MTTRRGNGEGSIYYDEKRDEYIGYISYGSKTEGTFKRKAFYSGQGGKRGAVVKKMNAWRL